MKRIALIILLALPCLGLAADPQTPLQQAKIRIAQLEADNSALRRQIALLMLRASAQEDEAREATWKALEQELHCTLDRAKGACQPEGER